MTEKITGYIFSLKNNKVNRNIFLLIIALFAGAFFVVSSAIAQVAPPESLYVHNTTGNDDNDCLTPSSPCATIQAAVDEAEDGDTIIVAAGSYDEEITIDKDGIVLKSEEKSGAIIDRGLLVITGDGVFLDGFKMRNYQVAGGGDPVIYINANNVTVQNMDLYMENFVSVQPYEIRISSESNNINILNNIVDRGFIGGHPAISVAEGADNVLIEGNHVAENGASAIAGGVGDGKTIIVKNNTVYNGYDEGIWFWPVSSSGNIVVENNTVINYSVGSSEKKAFKIVSEPNSINNDEKTSDFSIYKTIFDSNPNISSVELGWLGPVYNESEDKYYNSIQDAINEASSGDTILVAAGTYVEDLTIDKSLTLQGDGSATTEIQPTISANAAITVEANDVVIKGFTITHPTVLTYGIKVNSPEAASTSGTVTPETTGLILQDLSITNIGGATASANGYGLYISNSLSSLDIIDSNFISGYQGVTSRGIGVFAPNNLTLSDYNIEGSTFEYLFVGVYLRSSIDGLDITTSTFGPTEIEDCTAAVAGVYIGDGSDDNFDIENVNITNNTFTSYGRGVYVWNYAENTKVSNFDITHNTFTNSIWSSAVRFIAGLGDGDDISFDGINVSHNALTQNSDVGANIGLIDFRSYSKNAVFDIEVASNDVALSDGTYEYAIHGIMFFPWESPFTNTSVNDNTLDGGSTSGTGTPLSTGIAVLHKATTYWPTGTLEIDVKGNTITGFDNGLCVYDLVDSKYGNLPTGSKIDITNNSISGNYAYGVRNDNGEVVDARLNWWGSADGPEQGRPPRDAAISEEPEEETREKVSVNVLFDPWWANEEMTRDSNYIPDTGGGPINTNPPTTEGEVLGETDTQGEVLGETDSRDYEEQEQEKREEMDELNERKEKVEEMKDIVNALLEETDDEEKKNLLLELLEELEELEEAIDEELEATEEELEEIVAKVALTKQKERAENSEETINMLLSLEDLTEEERASLEELLERAQEIKGEIEERLNQ